MKALLMKFVWAFFWLFLGLIVAQNHQVHEPWQISIISLLTLLSADALKFLVRKIVTHALT